jgi:hypothetical protein
MTSMVGPVGALSVGPTASATEFEDDVDGGPLGGALPADPTASTNDV